ncbi:MAG TPA: glycoside hydrolase family 3 N-terminal domain-containing protein [Polyangiaceae bacterium]|nr:glycoside hydrolase family 3 N-terminal domain-containing protein [Polyangiaceae bacterium]
MSHAGAEATGLSIPRIPRIETLLSQMTPFEKAGQLSQLACHGPADEKTIAAVRDGLVGSFLNAPSLEHRNELQRVAVEESRLGIPLVFGRDVIHGYRTIFPIPLGQGATFDPDLAQKAAAIAAREASETGIDWVFAPMVDIARDPRWGRIAEGCGEDPLLTSQLGAAMVRGFQGTGGPHRVAACAKHYVGYGACEAGKEYNTTWIPERLLREVYLRSFQACVDAGVLTVMTGFNDLNGVPATGNEFILRAILKGECGFSGFVVSDWASIREMITHGLCADEPNAALRGISAGVDMDMAGRIYVDHLPGLIESGAVSAALVDDAVRRVLLVKHKLGLFERPYVQPPRQSVAVCEEHRAVAQQVVRESLVLLKNEGGVLPLARMERSIAAVGPLVDDPFEQLGCWAFDGRREDSVTVLTALRARFAGRAEIHFARGLPDCRSTDTTGFEEAARAAERADVTLAFVGENANLSGECRSRAFLDLPGAQQQLLERIARTGRPLVVVVMAGRPLLIEPICSLAKAVLVAWHPGTMGGPGIVDVLSGDVSPSGKLPVTFPRALGQIPIYYAFKNTGRPPGTDHRGIPTGTPLDPVGFETSYLDVDVSPLYPFGFGLSYTTFEYQDFSVSPIKARVGEPVTVRIRVRNTGSVEGVEVVQLYIRDLVASTTRPVRELKAFQRVALKPGESAAMEFALTAADLAFPGRDMKPTTEPGRFDVFVGGNSLAPLGGSFELV